MPAVVVPVLDEEASIGRVVGAMPVGYRAFVVDNASTDASASVAAEAGAVVVHEATRGFGAACSAGVEAVRADPPPDGVICFMDGDGSLDPRFLPRVAAPVLDQAADLVLGRRDAVRGAWPLHARVANMVLAAWLRRGLGVELRDLGPMRAMRLDDLVSLDLRDRRFGWPLEMVVRGHDAGWRIAEVDVPYEERTGRSKVTGTARGTVRTIQDMTRILADRSR